MKIYVVIKDLSDRALLERVLACRFDLENFVFVVAGGKSNASSLARSLLARRHEPVALVLDADATDDQIVSEQRSNFSTSLGLAGAPSLWLAVLFKPELEAVFFHDPTIVPSLFSRPLEPHEAALAKLAPKQLLDSLMRKAGYNSLEQLVKAMDADVAKRLLSTPELAELAAFAARHLASDEPRLQQAQES